MSSKVFKISAVAATIAASFGAHAALYNVYMDAPLGTGESAVVEGFNIQTFGVAVSPESTVCWSNDCDELTSKLAVEVKQYREGWNYRDQVPFFVPFGHNYFEDADYRDGFDAYCLAYIGYADRLCDEWANQQYYQGFYNERIGQNYNGSLTYIDDDVVFDENSIIASIDEGLATGTRYDGNVRSRAYATTDGASLTDLSLTDVGDSPETYLKSHASKTLVNGADYVTFGSVTETYDSDSEISRAAIWLNGALQEPISWISNSSADGDYRAHADIRDAVTLSDGKIYAVGYNSQDLESAIRFKANIFTIDPTDSYSVTSTPVGGFGDESTYLNQVIESVNENGKAIGSAKLNTSDQGSFSNRLFYIDDVTASSPSITRFLGGIFFSNANGKAGAINNYNDVVGTVDLEKHDEDGGNPRATRAFIANIGQEAGSAPIDNVARYLDDLTNGGNATTDNNQFRIIEASDINDAGVIAATALYCAGGYSSTAINATCSNDLSVVGVKLVPINGATDAQIEPRPEITDTVERQGAGLGFLALTLLGFLGFRRK